MLKPYFKPHFESNKKILKTLDSTPKSTRAAYLLDIKNTYDMNYHSYDNPLISDAEYDEFLELIKFVEQDEICNDAQSQSDYDLFSGSNNIGASPLSIFDKIDHRIPMLSLANALNKDDFVDFISKNARFLNQEENYFPELVCELKIDGLGFSASYKMGSLLHIATRGDGYVGEDVTKNVLTIENFPKTLNTNNPPKFLEVRGEIFMNRSDFEQLNANQSKNNQKTFANPRNAAAGSIRQINSSVTKSRKLNYLVYTIGGVSDDFVYGSQLELLQKFADFGFNVNKAEICKNFEDVFNYHSYYESNRNTIPFDVDGIVCKINQKSIQDRLGFVARSPRWAIAYKFSSIKTITKILDVEYGVGRTGLITPVAILQPVNIGGVIVKKSTLHNFDEIKRLGVKIGSKVVVQRAGDVIPKIISVVESDNESTQTTTNINIPTNCPSCGSVLQQEDGGVLVRCRNRFNCKDQILNSIEYFCSKEAFDIVGLSTKHIQNLYNLGFLKNIEDIFNLETKYEKEIKNLYGFGEKSASNLFESIRSRMHITLERFIYSLGFYGVGEVMSKMLAKYFKSIDGLLEKIITNSSNQGYDLKTQLKNDLLEIDGLGEKTVNDLVLTLFDDNFVKMLKSLSQKINIRSYERSNKDLQYSGHKIVFTGTLQNISRNEAKYKAETLGFTVVNSVSKDLSFIVVGQNPGSKLKFAIDNNIKVLNEEEWLSLGSTQNAKS
jgi:DNA ligase (NAD+)